MTHLLPPAILFDLDDTLLTYDAAGDAAWEEVCATYAPRLGVQAAELRARLRAHTAWYWSDPERHRLGRLDLVAGRQQVIAEVLRQLERADDALAWEMSRLREERHVAGMALFPGARALLRHLKQSGVRLGMITNGAEMPQRGKLDRFALWPFFDCVVIEGAFGIGKPHPEGFRHILDTLDVTPRDAWMVGDNLTMDIAPARALGLTTIWHDHRGTGLPHDAPARPDQIIRALGELATGIG